MDSTIKINKRCIVMYRITEEIKAYYSIYEFVSEINKDEVKRYDAFTWFYREKEEDNTDKTISIIIFCFKGAIHVPVLDSMSLSVFI